MEKKKKHLSFYPQGGCFLLQLLTLILELVLLGDVLSHAHFDANPLAELFLAI